MPVADEEFVEFAVPPLVLCTNLNGSLKMELLTAVLRFHFDNINWDL
jgi:hypothetical protein